MSFDFEWSTFLVVAISFALGGFVKGVVGLGLPLITVPSLSMVLPVPTAIAISAIPVILTNAVQFIQGSHHKEIFSRLGVLLVLMLVTLALSTKLMVILEPRILLLSMGAVVGLFVITNFRELRFTIPRESERWLAPVTGLVSGFIGGITSFFGITVALYLLAIKIPMDMFVTSVSLIYFSGATTLAIMLAKFKVLGSQEVILAATGLVPLFAGLFAGQRLRKYVSQQLFRRIILIVLFGVAMTMVGRGLSG